MLDFAWLIFAFPAAGALINLFFGPRLSKNAIGWIASGAVIGAFLVAVGLLFSLLGMDPHHREATIHLWDWIDIGNFHAPTNFFPWFVDVAAAKQKIDLFRRAGQELS